MMANLRTPARRLAATALLALTVIFLLTGNPVHGDPHPDPHASPDPHALADPVPLVIPVRNPPLVRGGDDTIKAVVADILDETAAPEDVKAGLGDAIEVPGATEAVKPPLDGKEKEEEPAPVEAEVPEETTEIELPPMLVDNTDEGNATTGEEPAPAVPEATQDTAAGTLDETQEATQIDRTPESKTQDGVESHPLRAREAMFQDASEPVADLNARIAAATPSNSINNNGKPTSTPSRATGTVEASLVPSTTTSTATATATSTGTVPDSFVEGGQLNLVFAAVAMNKGQNGQNAPSFQLTSDKSGLSFSAQYAV
ncbi:hypothetical protein AMAG_10777 [Allomyces macrogynus ATCC 38327]|uniref:Secreted protein n=1 Tax=Allomyces macrogynus (strain ATCC 38327) TaxID=578462 RepID=A0A0L0SRH7_ALLM3|nr:hypothetical protein AMAG_10777 [Allomyces macrogynus ATCC 38327]|eukprot:KNE65122.1 hypothetical protein AMAG_10777 [Allomyces macrogynus ATCC 38327]